MTDLTRLHNTISAVCPILGVSVPTIGTSVGATIIFDPAATVQQKTNGQTVLTAFDWSATAQTAHDNLTDRSSAASIVSTGGAPGKALRATVGILIDEINTLRQWIAAFKVEVAAATTLADLKSRVATLPATPDRTLAQAKTAMTNKINSGAAD